MKKEYLDKFYNCSSDLSDLSFWLAEIASVLDRVGLSISAEIDDISKRVTEISKEIRETSREAVISESQESKEDLRILFNAVLAGAITTPKNTLEE